MQIEQDSPNHPESAFLARGNGSYQATELTRGPWNPEHQHAGPPSALAAQAIARVAEPLGLTHFARLTANLFRPIPIAELNIVVETVYSGRNAGHFCAQVFAAGKEVARFTALVQREAEMTIPSVLPGHPRLAMSGLAQRSEWPPPSARARRSLRKFIACSVPRPLRHRRAR